MSASKGPYSRSARGGYSSQCHKDMDHAPEGRRDSSKIREELPYWPLCLNEAIKRKIMNDMTP